MKNEFGHIIKKKVENSSLTPPPMDWKGLSDAQSNSPKPTKSVLGSKAGLIVSAFVTVSVLTVLVSLFVSTPDEMKVQPEEREEKEHSILDSTSAHLNMDKLELDTLGKGLTPNENKAVVKEKKISPPLRKKKDKLGQRIKKNNSKSVENKETGSTTTIFYEVDTVTTETYIYE